MPIERLKEIRKALIKVRSMCENVGFDSIIELSAFDVYVKKHLKLAHEELNILIEHKEE